MLSSARIEQIKKLLEVINIQTDNLVLFDEALTHPSFNNESHINKCYDYERLEFLGDSVLRLFAGQYLYEKYPDYNEGQLTKIRSCIVSDKFLSGIAYKLEYYKYIDMGLGEEKDRGREKESVLACTFEAVLGAIYLSSGFLNAKNFIYQIYDAANIEETMHYYNAKERLQEYTQGINKDLPEYKVIKESGPAHDKIFEVGVYYHGNEIGTGKGKTKKEAEQTAARHALKTLNITSSN